MEILSLYTVGNWDIADSYGKVVIELARHLSRQGVRVNCIALDKSILSGSAPSAALRAGMGADEDGQPDDVRALTTQPILPTLGGIAAGWPIHFCKMSTMFHAGPRVALTMFESSRLPSSWLTALDGYDAIITPSHFCAQVFAESGISSPIYIIPLGVSDVYRYQQRPQTFSLGRPLTFLAFLDRGERKGGVTALQAFLRAFGADPTKKLILKGRAPKVGFSLGNPNIEVILQDMDEAELAALYSRCDVLINPHKGEGFGLIPREFAATGGVALTTNWSGTADGLPFWGVPIAYTLERAGWQGNKSLEGLDVGEWAKIDEAELADLLWQVVDNWPRQFNRAKQRAAFVRERYSWQRFSEQVWQVWKEVSHGERYLDRQPAAQSGYGAIAR